MPISDQITNPFRIWYNYISTGFLHYYLKLVTLGILELIIQIGLLIVFALIELVVLAAFANVQLVGQDPFKMLSSLATSTLLSSYLFLIVLAVVFFVYLFIAGWIQTLFHLASIVLTDCEFTNKPFKLSETVDKIKGKTLRYLVTSSVMWLVLMIPAIVLFLLSIGSITAALSKTLLFPTASTAGLLTFFATFFLALIYIIIVSSLFTFITQFWPYGFLFENLSVLEALKCSFRLIKSNLVSVFLFGVLLLFVAGVFSIPVVIYNFLSDFAFKILEIIGQKWGLMFWAVYLLLSILSSIISIFLTTLVKVLTISVHYLFWKGIKNP